MKKEKSFFVKQLRNIMFERNLTQKNLAKLANTEQQRISGWMTGIRNPSFNSMKKLADALKIPVEYFIESSDSSEKRDSSKNMEILQLKNKILKLEKEVISLKLQLEKERNKNKTNKK